MSYHLPPISSLMSPPEASPLDSFDASPRGAQYPSHLKAHDNLLPPIDPAPQLMPVKILPSPPTSPWKSHQHNIGAEVGKPGLSPVQKHADPVLYPGSSTVVDHTLFPSTPERRLAEAVVSQHIAKNRACHMLVLDKVESAKGPDTFSKRNTGAKPTMDEYLLVVSALTNLGRDYNRNPGAYLKRVRDETEMYWPLSKRICASPAKAKHPYVGQLSLLGHAGRQSTPKAKHSRKPSNPSRLTTSATKVQRAPRTPKPSPRIRELASPHLDGRSPTSAETPRQKRVDDNNYAALPDFCPPLDSLDPKRLKIETLSNNPLDLSTDPDRHMLHQAEVEIASKLRLTCATYLCSKRRIFEARRRAFMIGKEFRRTDAQQACMIDVNKASKLWVAYESLGWFQKHYVTN